MDGDGHVKDDLVGSVCGIHTHSRVHCDKKKRLTKIITRQRSCTLRAGKSEMRVQASFFAPLHSPLCKRAIVTQAHVTGRSKYSLRCGRV